MKTTYKVLISIVVIIIAVGGFLVYQKKPVAPTIPPVKGFSTDTISGSGSGTVSSGVAGQLGYYNSTGSTIVGTSTNPLYVGNLVATSTTGISTLAAPIFLPKGTTGAPSLVFSSAHGNQDGFYAAGSGSGTITYTNNGSDQITLGSNGTLIAARFGGNSGDASTPTYYFPDQTTGFFRPAAKFIGVTMLGVESFDFSAPSASLAYFSIGSTTPTVPLTVASLTTNATTTISIGQNGGTKGGDMELQRTDGTWVCAYIPAGATAFTIVAGNCPR